MRLKFGIAAVSLMAIALPAAAQDAPPNSGPYHIMDMGDSNVMLAAGGTRIRNGGEASVTVSVVSNADAIENDTARLDVSYRFQCSQRRFKTTGAAAYGLDGGLMRTIDDDMEWEAVNMMAPMGAILIYACDGTPLEFMEPINGDINGVAASYRESAAGQRR